MKIEKLMVGLLILLLGLALVVPACAKKEVAPTPTPTVTLATMEPVVLRAAHITPDIKGSATATDHFFADEVAKRTNGKVKIDIYWGEQLGKTAETLGLCRDGAVDMTYMAGGYFTSEWPLWSAPNSIPFVMRTVDETQQVGIRLPKEIPAIQEEMKRQNVKILYNHIFTCYQLFSTRPVLKFEDLKGLKVRTWGEDLPRAFAAAGGVGVTMFLPEEYEGLTKGIINATLWPLEVGTMLQRHKVAPHVCMWDVAGIVAYGCFINLDVWNRLPADVQQIILGVVEDTRKFDRAAVIEGETQAKNRILQDGATIHTIADNERQKWIDASPDFMGEWVKKMEAKGLGKDAKQMRDLWLEIVKQY